MIRGRGGARAAVALALVAFARSGSAALDVPGAPPGPIRIALLSTTPDDPLAGRLDAELRTIGVDVSRSVVSPTQGIETQVRDALAGGARAVIVADGHRTDVWIAEPGSDKVGLRQELEVDQDSGQQAILSLRTVEFLRISLGLVSEPTVAPLTSVPAVTKVLPPPPAARPRGWTTVDATAGALLAGGGGGPTVIVGLAARAQIVGMVGAELCLYAPLTEALLTGTLQGDPTMGAGTYQARTSVWMAGGGVLLAPRPERRLSVEIGAGALATVIRTRGITVTNNPYGLSPTSEVGVTGAFYGRGAARLRLAPRLSLRIDLFSGAVISPPHILFNDQAVAVWGPGFAAGLGGAELQF